MEELGEVLERLRSRLPDVSSADTIKEAAEPFCDDFFRLYFLYRGELSRDDTSAVLGFLTDSAPLLKGSLRYLMQDLLNRTNQQVEQSFQALEWIRLCEMRSAFEAFIELYEDKLPIGLMMPAFEEIEKMDEQITLKGETDAQLHPTLTPDSFPETHWWWELEA